MVWLIFAMIGALLAGCGEEQTDTPSPTMNSSEDSHQNDPYITEDTQVEEQPDPYYMNEYPEQ